MVAIPLTHRTDEPVPDDVLWTWLLDALAFVEAYFGPRDPAWGLGPIRVAEGGPHTYFRWPGLPQEQAVEVHLGPYAQPVRPARTPSTTRRARSSNSRMRACTC